METIEAKILLKNLLKRIRTQDDGTQVLGGVLTDDEIQALRLAFALLDGPRLEAKQTTAEPVSGVATPGPSPHPVQTPTPIPPLPVYPSAPEQAENEAAIDPQPDRDEQTRQAEPARKPLLELDLGTLSLPEPPENVRLCLDFGTAMSKATLIADEEDNEFEDIEVLRLGVPGDQEEISETMLISSVYIDNNGLLWFGKKAVDRSVIESEDGSRQRLDNIKRRLSEDGWDEEVDQRYNPTGLSVTHGDMVLAYLMYLTWAVNSCLEDLNHPWNLPRRFAMPCFSGAQEHETVHRLRRAIGEAQVLADTFYKTLTQGIPLTDFMAAKGLLRDASRQYPFVAEDLTEPLGVAGSFMSWKNRVDNLIMVIDVGAGTTDLSLFRIHVDPDKHRNTSLEIQNASRGIQFAGNHLDRLLIELILKKSGVTSDDPMWLNTRGAVELRIRDWKESLFNDRFVIAPLLNGTEVEVELEEFLDLEAVQKFGQNLRATMVDILESIDDSWINWILTHPSQKLVVALTGGGAELPMVTKLAEGMLKVRGQMVPIVRALRFPTWLRDVDEGLEDDFARVAVSLGGARRRLIQKGGTAHVTAGDVTGTPTLGGYYARGQ